MKYKDSVYNIKLGEYFADTDLKIEDSAVYNTFSGKTGILSANIDYDNPPSQLIKDGFVVLSQIDEAEKCIEISEAKIMNEKPRVVELTVAVTFRCNYHCSYCFEQCSRDIDLTDDILGDYIDYIKKEIDRNENLKVLRLIFFGGEPLIRLDVIRSISQFVKPYCEERHIKYDGGIVSNGYLFTPDVSKELKELGVKGAQVTLDGFETTYNKFRNPPPNAFKIVLQNIEESAIPIQIRLHALPSNEEEICQLASYLIGIPSIKRHKIKIHRVLDNPYPSISLFNDNEWLEFKEQACAINERLKSTMTYGDMLKPNYNPCRFCFGRNVALAPDGYIYRCDYNLGIKEKAVGTLKDGINADGDENKAYVSTLINDECRKCPILPVCHGGVCRHEVLLGISSCDYMKNRFKQNLRFHIEIEQKRKRRIQHGSLLPPKM